MRLGTKGNLAEIRIQAGYNQKSLASLVGITPAHLSKVERGTSNPSPPVAKKLAEALGEPWENLFFVK